MNDSEPGEPKSPLFIEAFPFAHINATVNDFVNKAQEKTATVVEAQAE